MRFYNVGFIIFLCKYLLFQQILASTTSLAMDTPEVTPNGNDTFKENPSIFVQKCCALDEMYSSIKGCVKSNNIDWTIGLYKGGEDLGDMEIKSGFPTNPDPNATCIELSIDEFHIVNDGTVFLDLTEKTYDTKSYCLDSNISENRSEVEPFGAICFRPLQREGFQKLARYFQKAGKIISCVSLATIIILHVPFSAPLNLQDKSFLCLCISLFGGFITLSFNMADDILQQVEYNGCIALAISSQFFFLSFYFWLCLMCYEIFRIVRGTVQSVIPLSGLSGGKKRFFQYCCISYGIPALICLLTVIIQILPKGSVPDAIRPDIGNGRCWFVEKVLPLGMYYYGYQITLHLLNIIFMSGSSILLFKAGVAFQCCKKGGRSSDPQLNIHNKSNLKMFWEQFSIFMVFVVIWAFDSFSLTRPKAYFWKIGDILNTLQGLYLLIIVLRSSRKRKIMLETLKRASSVLKSASEMLNSSKEIQISQIAIHPPCKSEQECINLKKLDAESKSEV